jgi:hypothetical protein
MMNLPDPGAPHRELSRSPQTVFIVADLNRLACCEISRWDARIGQMSTMPNSTHVTARREKAPPKLVTSN